jgi:hypothetical protein
MSEPTRDDLRFYCGHTTMRHHTDEADPCKPLRPVTDAELDAIARQQGYVKLDVDVEALRDTLHWMAEKDMGPDMDPRPAVLVGWRGDLVRKVLDAVLDALGGSDAPA